MLMKKKMENYQLLTQITGSLKDLPHETYLLIGYKKQTVIYWANQ